MNNNILLVLIAGAIALIFHFGKQSGFFLKMKAQEK